ncbi:hypothetical protein AB0O47_32710 [Streptomyces noursei]|uniref:hypothetical protein n=1 Tax=Streptomyces noursei TaxID=1971 RepID=UPI00344E1BCC
MPDELDDDLAEQLPEGTEARSAEATAIRVTPRDEAGRPDHAWGLTYRFDDQPVGLHLVTVQVTAEVRAFDPTKRFPFSIVDRVDAALTASENHPRFRDVQALAQGLWQHRRTTATVEAWGPKDEPGTWWHVLIPAWRDSYRWEGDNPLPVQLPEGHRVYGAGHVERSWNWAWPAAGGPVAVPVEDPEPVGADVWFLLSMTTVPPPDQGFPPRHPEQRG